MFSQNQLLEPRDRPLSRKKGHMITHAVAFFSYTDICNLKKGESADCLSLDFWRAGGRESDLEIGFNKITVESIHNNKYRYYSAVGGINPGYEGDFRSNTKTYEKGCGTITDRNITLIDIGQAAIKKWGEAKIPYSHGFEASYNCYAFTDDIIHWAKYGTWNPRIESCHTKYKLMGEEEHYDDNVYMDTMMNYLFFIRK
jgi:hypothetical protein